MLFMKGCVIKPPKSPEGEFEPNFQGILKQVQDDDFFWDHCHSDPDFDREGIPKRASNQTPDFVMKFPGDPEINSA